MNRAKKCSRLREKIVSEQTNMGWWWWWQAHTRTLCIETAEVLKKLRWWWFFGNEGRTRVIKKCGTVNKKLIPNAKASLQSVKIIGKWFSEDFCKLFGMNSYSDENVVRENTYDLQYRWCDQTNSRRGPNWVLWQNYSMSGENGKRKKDFFLKVFFFLSVKVE